MFTVSGIIAVLATGGSILDAGTPIALHASLQAHSTKAEQWNDTRVALASSLNRVDTRGRPESSLAAVAALDLVCTFEGQLHNTAELKADLGGASSDQTHSELALQAYARWGETFVGRLRGDFALVIWDGRLNRLVCARDPMGIKALYFYKTADSFIVASDLALLLSLCERAVSINPKAVAAYISGDPLTTDTFYEGIAKLPQDTGLIVSAHDAAQRTFRHWSVSDIKPIRYARSEDYAEHFRDVFSDAIRCRLNGAHRTGLFLSGGLDSSSIACVLSRILSAESPGAPALLTFSAISDHCRPDPDGEVFDETSYISEVVGAYGIDARFFRCEDFLDEDEFTPRKRALPIPPGTGVFRRMFRSASEADVTVMLSGIGGDEVLGASYEIYLLSYADLLLTGDTRELMEDLRHARKYYPWSRVVGLFWRYGCWPLLNSLFGRLSTDAHRQPRSTLSFSQEQIYLELSSGELAGYAMEAFNLIGREEGVEARYPYLDKRLVEFCLAVPPAELSRHYETKLLLRRGMAGILPEKLRLRVGKASSTSLLHTWLTEKVRPNVEAILAHPTMSQGLDWDVIRKLFAEYCNGNMDHGRQITKSIGLELWHRANYQGGTTNGYG